jgi:SH3-like domain-containing protein
MAQLRLAHLRDSSLFRATVLVATFLLIATAAAWLLPRQVADAATVAERPKLVFAPWRSPKSAPAPVDLVSSTFDLLEPDTAAPPTKRVVQTVPVPVPTAAAGVAPLESPAAAPIDAVADEPVVTDAVAVATVVATTPNEVVAIESVNVRSGPGKSKSRVFVLAEGASAIVDETHRGWLHLTDSQGRAGWAYSSSFNADAVAALTAGEVEVATLTDVTPVPKAKAKAVPKPAPKTAAIEQPADDVTHMATVLGKGVTVRSGPGKSNAALYSLAGGANVLVHENKGGWLRITDPKGRGGWLYKDFVRDL